MAEQTTLSAIGLHTSENELGLVPAGGLIRAENCIMLAPGVIGSRRGQAPIAAPSATPRQVAFFSTVPVVATEDDTVEYLSNDVWTPYDGTYTPADAGLLRMQFMEAAQNLYWNTDRGVYRLDKYNGVPVLAGIRVAPDISTAATNTTTPGFLAGGASCAYRIVFGDKDSHNTPHLGTPSGRFVVQNTSTPDVAASGTLTITAGSGTVGGTINGTTVPVTWATSDNVTAAALATAITENPTLNPDFTASALNNVVTITCRTAGTAGNSTTLTASGTGVVASGATFTGGTGGESHNVELTFPIPTWVNTTHYFQVYRTYQTAAATGGDFVDPGDEEYLAFERYFTSQDIALGSVTVTDTNLDSFLGAPLYTNQIGGEGISQANGTPPFCKDMEDWNGCAWYANTRQRDSVTLQIIGCGPGADGNTGVRLGDTLRLGNVLLIASETEGEQLPGVSYLFQLFTDGDPGANIENTARSLVNVINANLSAAYTARYVSTTDGAPGIVVIEATNLRAVTGATTFAITLNAGVFTVNIGGMTRAANVTTVTTTEPHGLATGDTVYIRPFNTADAAFPAVLTGAITVTSDTQFTFADPGANATTTHLYLEQRVSPAAALAWKPPPPVSYFDVAAGGLVRAANIVTVTCSQSHNLVPGNYVTLEAATVPDANFPVGTKLVASIPTSTTFTYAEVGTSASSTTAYQSGNRLISDPYQGVSGPSFLSYSKTGQPEAVPVLNYLGIGRTDTQILRISAQEQLLFVFKEEGVYIVTYVGGAVPYRVDLHDSTVHLFAPDSVANVSGRTYALTNQGVVSGTSAGWRIISTPIEQELFQYFGPTLPTVRVEAYGVSRETDRLYKIRLPTLSGATTAPYSAPLAYVYSTIADAWTMEMTDRTCERTRTSDDAVFLGTTGGMLQENNTKTSLDYADGTLAVEVTDWDETTLTMSLVTTSGLTAGDAIVQGSTKAIVTDVVDGTDVVLSAGGFTGAIAATGSLQFTGASGAVTVTINGQAINMVATGDPAADAATLANAINDISSFTEATASFTLDSVLLTAITPGPAGNSITIDSSDFLIVIPSGATLTGGAYGEADAYLAIPIVFQWRPFVGGSLADEKHFREAHVHFRERYFRSGTVTFLTDQCPDGDDYELAPFRAQDGVVPTYSPSTTLYPGMPVLPTKHRIVALPQTTERCAYMSVRWDIREAFAMWWLNGLTLVFEPVSERSSF